MSTIAPASSASTQPSEPTPTPSLQDLSSQPDQGSARTHHHAQRVRDHQAKRASVHAARARQVAALFPAARTFAIVEATHLGHPDDEGKALEQLPRTLTLVTPDHDDPSQDHLFVGPYPVPESQSRFDHAFQELTFTAHDGTEPIHGQLRLVRARTRAYGIMEIRGESYSVAYAVKPQRYTMRIGQGRRLPSRGRRPCLELKWDVDSDRWKDAPWSDNPDVAFTYGVDGREVLEGEDVLTFVANFDDLQTGKHWVPVDGYYSGLLSKNLGLQFGVVAGVTPPPSGRDHGTLFPYRLSATMSEFGDRFDGAMLNDAPGLNGTVYGIQGTWTGGSVAGLYHLTKPGSDTGSVVGVHDGRLHVGAHPVDSQLHGNTLSWTGLAVDLATTTGLPVNGHLTFSADGASVIDSASGHGGVRVSPSEAATAAANGSAELHGLAFDAAQPDPSHSLTTLLAMSQFAISDNGSYYDQFQSKSMEDFYAILQDYMDAELRKQFFNPNPPPLDPGLTTIAEAKGANGEEPKQWYGSLRVAYATAALSKWSSDPGCALLNGRRATPGCNQTGISPVMLAQGPLLYARRYHAKYASLDWFLVDQRDECRHIRTGDRREGRPNGSRRCEANTVGTPEQLQISRSRSSTMRDKAIAKKLLLGVHAVVYTYATTPAYLNMMQTIMASGDEVDGSEFTQRVQRTTRSAQHAGHVQLLRSAVRLRIAAVPDRQRATPAHRTSPPTWTSSATRSPRSSTDSSRLHEARTRRCARPPRPCASPARKRPWGRSCR